MTEKLLRLDYAFGMEEGVTVIHAVRLKFLGLILKHMKNGKLLNESLMFWVQACKLMPHLLITKRQPLHIKS